MHKVIHELITELLNQDRIEAVVVVTRDETGNLSSDVLRLMENPVMHEVHGAAIGDMLPDGPASSWREILGMVRDYHPERIPLLKP